MMEAKIFELKIPILSIGTPLRVQKKMITDGIPHSYSGLIGMISVELRNSEHSFCKHCQESYQLYKSWKAEEQVGDITTDCNKYQHTQHIIREVRPIPEVSSVKI